MLVCSADFNQKHGFKNAPKPYYANGNDEKNYSWIKFWKIR